MTQMTLMTLIFADKLFLSAKISVIRVIGVLFLNQAAR
jgi:hypothetical protein